MKSKNLLKYQNEELIQSKNKRIIENISCKYILDLILDKLKKNRQLKIIKYNKNLQSKLEISLKDYIQFSQIEIIIKPGKDKYGKFINIPNNEEESNFHIYFNNNTKEEKKTFFNIIDEVKTIKIIINHKVKSFYSLFEDCECIESIYFKSFYRTDITNMCRMFSWCSSLKEIDISIFNTDNVTDMSCMFAGCSSLTKVIFPNIKIDKVKDISYIFSGCYSLKQTNLDKLNINKIQCKTGMFNGCNSFTEFDISQFNK